MWEGLAARLEGELVVLEPLRPEHENGLYEAACEMDWTWMFVPTSTSLYRFQAKVAGSREPFMKA